MGEVLGRYHIISELGRGGMGVVYKALDPKLERFIAIKCLSDELSEDEIVVARFLREARNVAALNHPNIAQIFVADEHDGKPYFVMEYVDGESLADFIDREGQCSPEMARRVTEQAANALAAAGEEGIVHRDVKPGNIMIDRRGRAVLTDFGIACVAAEQAGSDNQSVMGTPGYLAPEALSGSPVDSRSDMFALGAVWYEMLTGERLMPGRDLKETFKQLAAGGFPDLSPLDGKVDERVIEILGKLLAVQPEDRYADWPALLADMQPLKTGRTGPVERSDSGPSTAEREVTEALATAQSARLATATASAPEATTVVQTETERQHPVPVQSASPQRRGPMVAVVAILLVLVLAMTGAGFGLAHMAPATWSKMTAWLPGGGEPAEEAAAVGSAESTPESEGEQRQGDPASAAGARDPARAGMALADEGSGAPSPEEAVDDVEGAAGSGDTADFADSTVGATQSATGPETAGAEVEPAAGTMAAAKGAASDDFQARVQDGSKSDPGMPEPEPEPADERTLAMTDSNADAAASTAAPARPASPAPPPKGIVVIGVGDPVIADPMVREIESALRGGAHPLIQPNFVRGYRDYIQGEELDLAGLAEPALDAGARYVVLARALPAGERELQYYNRVETAFIAQLETVTYDLHAMRQMGSSPVEQIEFTALNATRRAVDSVEPWLEGIKAQFD
jgi:serine/threonine-protein kinase